MPTVEYDGEAQSLYLRFSSAEVDDTIALSDSVYVDVDKNGDPIGIEVLHVTLGDLPGLDASSGAVALRELLKFKAA
jgi:uncharacterized protein YuzE